MAEKNLLDILQELNYRNKKPMNIGYLRTKYLEYIQKSFGTKNLIKVLLWERRSGKSVIMKQLISYLINEKNIQPENILYLDLEQYNLLKEIKNADDLERVVNFYLENIHKEGTVYLFIDEIQLIQNWELYVNGLRANDNKDFEIIISWSNSKLLSWELATRLSWRYISFFIQPFSYEEYIWVTWEVKGIESLAKYLNIWWMPELFSLNDEWLRTNYIKQLNDTIIFKDISSRYWIKDISTLISLYVFLLGNIGNLFSINTIVKKLKSENIETSVPTIWRYLCYFKDAYIFHEVSRYDLIGKKVLEWEKKYYLNDLSFLNYSLSNYVDYNWKKLENFVYNYLIWKGYDVYVWKIGDNEVDFIAEKAGKKIYIQVAYSIPDERVAEREYWNLIKIKDSFPKYVITMDPMNYGVDEYGIIHQQAWNINL